MCICITWNFQNNYYNTPDELGNIVTDDINIVYGLRITGDLEIFSQLLLSHPNSSDPLHNKHYLIGTMLYQLTKLTCRWVR